MPLWLITLGARAMGWLKATRALVARYPWQAACIALALFAAWALHGKRAEHADRLAERTTWSRAFAQEQAAYRVQSRNVTTLLAAIGRQDASIRQAAAEGERAHQRQQAALSGARQAAAGAEAIAARLRAEAATQVDGADCLTPDSVMAEKGRI